MKRTARLGWAWLALCAALALHVTDEALTGFLSVYNPTVEEMRQRIPWFPMPVFRFDVWLGGLILATVLLFALAPLAFSNARRWRWGAHAFAALMIANGLGHTAGTIAGRTVASVTFARPMPGFYSSPLLVAASVWLLLELQRSRLRANIV
jgi:hypothetical protein